MSKPVDRQRSAVSGEERSAVRGGTQLPARGTGAQLPARGTGMQLPARGTGPEPQNSSATSSQLRNLSLPHSPRVSADIACE